jgi:hypothetical protein
MSCVRCAFVSKGIHAKGSAVVWQRDLTQLEPAPPRPLPFLAFSRDLLPPLETLLETTRKTHTQSN